MKLVTQPTDGVCSVKETGVVLVELSVRGESGGAFA